MGIALTAQELYEGLDKEQKARIKFSESFASWAEFLDATERPSNMNPGARASMNTGAESAKWSGCNTIEEARKLARFGWPEGNQKISKESASFMRDFSERITRPEWVYEAEASGQLDVARFLDDEPECWLTVKDRETIMPALTIVSNLAVSGSIDKSVIEARGLIVATLAQALEFGGIKTRIIITEVIESYGNTSAEMYITLKDFGEILDLDALAFAIIHPSTLRRLFFAYEETWNDALRDEFHIGNGYGRPQDSSFKGDIYFGRLHGSENVDLGKIKEMTNKILKKHGIKFSGQEVAK